MKKFATKNLLANDGNTKRNAKQRSRRILAKIRRRENKAACLES